jgi:hypothetical protein
MFEVVRDETDIAWLNAIAIEDVVEIETAEVEGAMLTTDGAYAATTAEPVVN